MVDVTVVQGWLASECVCVCVHVCVCVSVCPPMHGIVYEYGTRTILQIPDTIIIIVFSGS